MKDHIKTAGPFILASVILLTIIYAGSSINARVISDSIEKKLALSEERSTTIEKNIESLKNELDLRLGKSTSSDESDKKLLEEQITNLKESQKTMNKQIAATSIELSSVRKELKITSQELDQAKQDMAQIHNEIQAINTTLYTPP